MTGSSRRISDASAWLSESGVPFALIGGLAATIRGRVRVTEDVDCLLACDLADAVALLQTVDGSPFDLAFEDADRMLQTAFILPLDHLRTGVRLDLSVGLTLFEQEAVARAERQTLNGITIPVITGEDLLVMKLLADRPKDQQDIEGIVETADERFDWDHCRRLTEEFDREAGLNLTPRLDGLRGSG